MFAAETIELNEGLSVLLARIQLSLECLLYVEQVV